MCMYARCCGPIGTGARRWVDGRLSNCCTTSPMPLDDPNRPGSLEEAGFTAVDTISANDKSLEEILSCILHHEEAGTPVVVRGLDADPNWSLLPGQDPPEGSGDVEHQPPGRWMGLSLNVSLI